MPSDAGLRTEPGTAMTGTPRCSASETVSNEPPRTLDSTTTTSVGQRGDDAVAGREPVGRRRACPAAPPRRAGPRSADLLPEARVAARVDDVEPAADDRDRRRSAVGGRARRGGRRRRCPWPGPDTTAMPAAARSRAERGRDLHPADGGVAGADDGHARRRQGAPASPRVNRTPGGSGSSARSAG